MSVIHRRHWLWASFGLLLTIGLAALAVLSITALRLGAAEAAARRAAAVEENLRLALWRIDTAWAPLVAQEGIRPIARYTSAVDPGEDTEAALPSRLAIRSRFEWSPGRLAQAAAHQGGAPAGGVQHRDTQSNEPAASIDFPSLWRQLPAAAPATAAGPTMLAAADTAEHPKSPSRSVVEFQNRNQAVLANNALVQRINTANAFPAAGDAPAPPPLVPLWDDGQMLLARRVEHNGNESLQGSVLDWDRLRQWSLALISDLLPEAALEPLSGSVANGGPDMLAALPVRLIPGSLVAFDPPARFSVPLTLAIAWSGVLLAAAVGVVLLRAVIQLSERRAAFVAAVTHELRTPLTTFQLYTEMLSAGMVPDQATQRSYLETLRSEALRLNHLVENVLAYARLERGRWARATESLTLAALTERIQPRLEQLAQRGDMQLVVQPSEAFATSVCVNVCAVEQIVLNLVDNACKYAAGAADRRIVISAVRSKRDVELRVCDHGPGLPAGNHWLRPFSKTAHQAAESSPGIGLGLALSSRLARQLGGSLRPERAATPPAGACFVLRLPIAR